MTRDADLLRRLRRISTRRLQRRRDRLERELMRGVPSELVDLDGQRRWLEETRDELRATNLILGDRGD